MMRMSGDAVAHIEVGAEMIFLCPEKKHQSQVSLLPHNLKYMYLP